jgi:hypothetical protein
MRKLITSVAVTALVAFAGIGLTSNAAFAGHKHGHHHGHHKKHYKHHGYGYWGWGLGGLATGFALGYAANSYAQPTVQYVPTPVYPAQPAYVYDPYTGQYLPAAPAYYTPAPVIVP